MTRPLPCASMSKTRPAPAEFSNFRVDYGPMAARRRYLNVSQRRLASSVGVNTATIHRVETGRTTPTHHLTVAIAKALGVPIHDLYRVIDLPALNGR